MARIDSKPGLLAAAQQLSALRDADPSQAITEARKLEGRGRWQASVRSLRAGILIDAGVADRDPTAVREGVTICRRLVRKSKDNLGLVYNLANGLCSQARLAFVPGKGWANWYSETHVLRRDARVLFARASRAGGSLRAKALINLGNELDAGFRWVEAYDRWVEAIQADPANGVSTLSIASMLSRRIVSHKHGEALHRVAGYYARMAARNVQSIRDIAGPDASRVVKRLPTFRSTWRPRKVAKLCNDYGRFVALNRLALVGTVEGLDLRRRRWDDVHVKGIGVESGKAIPSVFAMINQLKADYCTARWLAYLGIQDAIPETAVYVDTLDYARYGTSSSGLVLAQRAALDVLDRVAVCANDYFRCGLKPQEICFAEFWRHNGGTGRWAPYLGTELESGNPGVVALGELAADLSEGALLNVARSIRNIGTHRFHTVYDESVPPSSAAIQRHDVQQFEAEALRSLQIARSAILYLLDAIEFRERTDGDGDRGLTIPLPSHDWVRGR